MSVHFIYLGWIKGHIRHSVNPHPRWLSYLKNHRRGDQDLLTKMGESTLRGCLQEISTAVC